jgi:hypothetical protein
LVKIKPREGTAEVLQPCKESLDLSTPFVTPQRTGILGVILWLAITTVRASAAIHVRALI